MRCFKRGFSRCFVASVLFLLAGCASTRFVYKPGMPQAGVAKLQMKVAVLPFTDGTENFTTRGSVFSAEGMTINLVKAGFPGTTSALTPELWGKYFADDLAASGVFRSARFVYNRSELLDEEILIDGTVEKAYAIGSWDRPNEVALSFRAIRKVNNLQVWETKAARVWTPIIQQGCGLGTACIMDQRFADMNRAMQEIFAEVRDDLVRTLAHADTPGADRHLSVPGNGISAPLTQESAEQTIDQILKQR